MVGAVVVVGDEGYAEVDPGPGEITQDHCTVDDLGLYNQVLGTRFHLIEPNVN